MTSLRPIRSMRSIIRNLELFQVPFCHLHIFSNQSWRCCCCMTVDFDLVDRMGAIMVRLTCDRCQIGRVRTRVSVPLGAGLPERHLIGHFEGLAQSEYDFGRLNLRTSFAQMKHQYTNSNRGDKSSKTRGRNISISTPRLFWLYTGQC